MVVFVLEVGVLYMEDYCVKGLYVCDYFIVVCFDVC